MGSMAAGCCHGCRGPGLPRPCAPVDCVVQGTCAVPLLAGAGYHAMDGVQAAHGTPGDGR